VSVADPVFNASLPGNYALYVTVTDINGRKAIDTLNISVHPNPVAQISVPDTVVCVGFDLGINGIVNGGSGTYISYNWTAEPSVLSYTNTTNPVFNTVKPGIYRIVFTATDDKGCAGSDSAFIFNDSPVSSFTSDAVPGCSPLEVNFTNTSVNAVTYLWDFGDGQTSTAEDPSHRFVNTTTSLLYFDVNLTAISANNCMHTSNAFVTVYPSPGLEITPYPAVACSPADVLMSATPGGYSYDWDFGDGIDMNGSFNAHHTFNNTTDNDISYNVSLISRSFFNCLDTAHVDILVHPSPQASFVASPLSQMIPDKTINIQNTTPEGIWTYSWSFGDGSFSDQREPGSHEYGGPDDYMLKLVVSSEHCADSAFASIEIKPHPPVAMFKGVTPGCTPLTIQFENMSAYSNEFLWEFGDGAVSNKPNPDYTYYEPGTYKIKLTAWGEGGTDSYSTVNNVYILPNAYFETAPRIVYVNDEEVHFFNLSDNGDKYMWEFGDGTFSDDLNPTHMYEKEGEYDIVLNVWTKEGCYDLYEMKEAVIVKPSGIIYFPTCSVLSQK
jgi:PKD repeat protein